MSAVHDGRCSPWVMCSCSVVRGNRIRDRAPPQRAASRRFTYTAPSRREVEPGEGTEGQVHVEPMRPEPTRAEQTRQAPSRAERTRQAPSRAERTRQAPSRAERTRQAPYRAERTRQAPYRAEQRPTAETGT